ncbi:MAG TPA: SEC-C metal-binding domain-containing protein [Armatimonadota bacterium]|nr:SEC-C metal-binding domain-containing protein [Armatimonadota bacterium]
MAGLVGLAKRIIDSNERELASARKSVERINVLEPAMEQLTDGEIAGRAEHFRHRLAEGETLDDILEEAFAVVREGSKRALGMRPFDVQLIGAIILHRGRVAEMKTGEGKTLTATLPLYLNALGGGGIHLVTTNDFLVRWQAEWMGRLYEFLGLTCGYIQHTMRPAERRAMYAKDITYVENSELGFDYLRDNMAVRPENLVLPDLTYAIIDEVDSILIDEARTPLIISGMPEQSEQFYEEIDRLIKRLRGTREKPEEGPDGKKVEPDADYMIDEKFEQVALTDRGTRAIERALGIDNLSAPEYLDIKHHVDNSLKAHGLYHSDDNYVVKDGEVIIVDEFTGHLQPGRRYGDGLHQAIEAKEGVRVQSARQTVATITYQNFFKLYNKLAGMTGTAKTEDAEFRELYGMPVVCVPTNEAVVRRDHPDIVFKTGEAKYRGIVDEIMYMYVREQPVLVGSRSVETSEYISSLLVSDRLAQHSLVMVLLNKLRNGEHDLRKDRVNELRGKLFEPLAEMKRAELNAVARELGVEPDAATPANVDAMLRHLGVLDDGTDDKTLERYRRRLERVYAEGIEHNVLNAKQHEREGQIIAEAGRPGGMTIATNMAGRGVDIVLGGKPDDPSVKFKPKEYDRVKSEGGLHILGAERHESRRIDNQLRGRSGRQGDPGSSRFFVSLEDELMRLFGPDRFGILLRGWPEDESIEARLVSRSIERAQEKVEMRNFDIRKNTLKYDDVMNVQRSVIYGERRRVLMGEDLSDAVRELVGNTVSAFVQAPEHNPDVVADWVNGLANMMVDLKRSSEVPLDEMDPDRISEALREALPGIEGVLSMEVLRELDHVSRQQAFEDAARHLFLSRLFTDLADTVPGIEELVDREQVAGMDQRELAEHLQEKAQELYARKEQTVGPELMRHIERSWLLRIIDARWMQHLKEMDYLREGIGLRAYGQRDPIMEYTKDAYDYFEALLEHIARDVTKAVLLTQVEAQPVRAEVRDVETKHEEVADLSAGAAQAGEEVRTAMSEAADGMVTPRTYVAEKEPGRNDPCPCGSGKKYKHCCMGKARAG